MMKFYVLAFFVALAVSQPIDPNTSDVVSFANEVIDEANTGSLGYPSANLQDLEDNTSGLIDEFKTFLSLATARCSQGDLEVAALAKVYGNLHKVFCGAAEDLTVTGEFNNFVAGIQQPTKTCALSTDVLENELVNSAVEADAAGIISRLEFPADVNDCARFLGEVTADVEAAEQSLRDAQDLCETTKPEFTEPLSDSTSNGVVMVKYVMDRLNNDDFTRALIFEQIVKIVAGLPTDQ
ncbi:hypothetical protein ACFFRR_006210 [Megaselia abdita]